jgi:hypothetical protein
MAADETATNMADIMNQLIADAANAEARCDVLNARVTQLEEQFASSRARMLAFYPIAHDAISLYNDDMYMLNYQDLFRELPADPNKMVKVPESDVPVRLVDPICRTELTRVLHDLGYKSELLDIDHSADFQITGHVGDQIECAQCNSIWTVKADDDGEWHHPQCSCFNQ